MQKILAFDLYKTLPPIVSNHRVNLVKSESDHTPIAKDISLQELYDKHVAPGKMLYMTQPVSKTLSKDYKKLRDQKIAEQFNNYAIVEAHPIKAKLAAGEAKVANRGQHKIVHMLLANPIEYTKIALNRAYHFIEQGSPVEVRVRMLGAAGKGKTKDTPVGLNAWTWMHAHFPHLRPDFIRKAMPEGTDYLVKPVSDGRIVQFVLTNQTKTMSKTDLTDRVFKVKKMVSKNLSKGVVKEGVEGGESVGKEEATKENGESIGEASGAGAVGGAEVEIAEEGLGRRKKLGDFKKQQDRDSGMDRRGRWDKSKGKGRW